MADPESEIVDACTEKLESDENSLDLHVRSLQRWEIPRDHVHFGDLFGVNVYKRQALDILEEPLKDVHDGVLLVAAGNTAQIWTIDLYDRCTSLEMAVKSRRYLFGRTGSGISAVSVHVSKRYYAIAEMGVKPLIQIYKYPSNERHRMLPNGAERGYSCLAFCTKNEDTYLASVASSPDYMLSVWNWKTEQIILRCKAFGQDIYNVAFAPNDSGFLITSGMGHIQFWKMACTFTGMKLQGLLGKFGKSELCDIEAFCVLPEQKIMSGTESGLLLLWEGQYIKHELLRYPERSKPHSGAIVVVQYEEQAKRILTAGQDGFVRFWGLQFVPEDELTALIPCEKEVFMGADMIIQRVLLQKENQYLVQESKGSIHQFTLDTQSDHRVVYDYIGNITGIVTGVTCSPYEHFAATCGEDGRVRAWDYMDRKFLFAADAPYPIMDHSNCACCIAWVPNDAAIQTDKLAVSRQVIVGYGDGSVRVFCMDITASCWVRTNVFKPHYKPVTSIVYASSGQFMATASEDGTIFFFQILLSESEELEAPEYVPLAFQRADSAIFSLVWREDECAILIVEDSGAIVEFSIPQPVEDMHELYAIAASADQDADELESYEVRLPSRKLEVIEHSRPYESQELNNLVDKSSKSGLVDAVLNEAINSGFRHKLKAQSAAIYAVYDPINPEMLLVSTSNGLFVRCGWENPSIGQTLASECPADILLAFNGAVTSANISALHPCNIMTVRLSNSGQLLLCGLSNGKYQIRASAYSNAFATAEFHFNVDCSSEIGKSSRFPTRRCMNVAISFDDKFVLAAGADGTLSIARVNPSKVMQQALTLETAFDKLKLDAETCCRLAIEKQQDVVNLQLKQEEISMSYESNHNASSSTELSQLPAFHGALSYALHIEKVFGSMDPAHMLHNMQEIFDGTPQMHDASNKYGPIITRDNVENILHLERYQVSELANAQSAYTIEDARLKHDQDTRQEGAAIRKQQTREIIKELRQRFEELRKLDSSYDPQHRLNQDEWIIDSEYAKVLEAQSEQENEQIKAELAIQVQNANASLAKVKAVFLSNIAVERITLHGYKNGASVQTFRITKIPDELRKTLEEAHRTDKKDTHGAYRENVSDGNASVLDIVLHGADIPANFPIYAEERRLLEADQMKIASVQLAERADGANEVDSGNALHPVKKTNVHGFAARKRMRSARKVLLENCLASKPAEDADDPRDTVAIAYSQRNLGDYKLKSAENYVVPDNQRVNAAKKKMQMALLQEEMFKVRLAFDAKVLELRKMKYLLIQQMISEQQRIQHLQESIVTAKKQLREEVEMKLADDFEFAQSLTAAQMEEWPERREEVTDVDVQKYRETKQAHHQAISVEKLLSRPKGEYPPISNSKVEDILLSKAPAPVIMYELAHQSCCDDPFIKRVRREIKGYKSSPDHRPSQDGPQHASNYGMPIRIRHVWLNPLFNSIFDERGERVQHRMLLGKNTDEESVKIQIRSMKQEIQRTQHKQKNAMLAFDQAITHLRMEKLHLDVQLKESELHLCTQLKELELLQQFESRENMLSTKLSKITSEKALITAEIEELQDTMTIKRQNMEDWGKEEKIVAQSFDLLLAAGSGSAHSAAASNSAAVSSPTSASGSQNPHYAALHKIFRKKIKRSKKKAKATNEDGVEDENSDEESSEEEDSEVESGYDDDDEDVCPPGCDLSIYEKVLSLRERRADIDDVISELSKLIEDVRKSHDRQLVKQRQIDKDFQVTEQEIQLFQTEKQMRFNEIDIVVPLTLHQIRCLTPANDSNCSVPWILGESSAQWLVFTLKSFQDLAQRIQSLQYENKALKQKFRDLHKTQIRLKKDKKVQQHTISIIKDRCEQLQLLKFGKLIDIDLLDEAYDTNQLDDLQSQVRAKELEIERTGTEMTKKRQELKLALLKSTQKNTELLDRIGTLNELQFSLDLKLNQTNSTEQIFENNQETLEKDMADRNKLTRLVKLQSKEIEALKQEIALIRGKRRP